MTDETKRPVAEGAGDLDRHKAPEGRQNAMKRTQALHDAGQSIWLDNITRTCSIEASWTATSPGTR